MTNKKPENNNNQTEKKKDQKKTWAKTKGGDDKGAKGGDDVGACIDTVTEALKAKDDEIAAIRANIDEAKKLFEEKVHEMIQNMYKGAQEELGFDEA
eukprot:CAMPEP_0116933842 /NCGR_PEP_ID=MMETSP0467-20121206/29287_1 /TAXON_ID=283647 /ORGANISM="Mesodinium pulex, Strain SPMC105" /LENGTH=96 /DNA_ID=CAMNT_0004614819 /DNA_START=112 /DNA_END=402 /DNA_ORIENTATION=+